MNTMLPVVRFTMASATQPTSTKAPARARCCSGGWVRQLRGFGTRSAGATSAWSTIRERHAVMVMPTGGPRPPPIQPDPRSGSQPVLARVRHLSGALYSLVTRAPFGGKEFVGASPSRLSRATPSPVPLMPQTARWRRRPRGVGRRRRNPARYASRYRCLLRRQRRHARRCRRAPLPGW